jgi:phosphate/sulfate permease
MLIAAAIVLGALVGWRRAARRGGDRLDQLQYAAVHAIALGLAATIVVVLLGRFGVA